MRRRADGPRRLPGSPAAVNKDLTVTIAEHPLAGARLTGRDVAAMTWIHEMAGVRQDALAVLLARLGDEPTRAPLGERAVRRVVRRWLDLGLVERRTIMEGSPAWIWLTRRGVAQLASPHGYREPRVALLAHTHAVACIRLALMAHPRHAGWTSERELLAGMLKAKGPRPHLADGLWHYDHDDDIVTIAVEAELHAKSARRWRDIWNEVTAEWTAQQSLPTDASAAMDIVMYAPVTVARAAQKVIDADRRTRVHVRPLEEIFDQVGVAP